MSSSESRRFRGLRQLWASGEGLALLLSFVFCVVTSIFMSSILPVEEAFGAVGVLFIYVTVFVLMSGIFRMVITRIKKRGARGDQEAA